MFSEKAPSSLVAAGKIPENDEKNPPVCLKFLSSTGFWLEKSSIHDHKCWIFHCQVWLPEGTRYDHTHLTPPWALNPIPTVNIKQFRTCLYQNPCFCTVRTFLCKMEQLQLWTTYPLVNQQWKPWSKEIVSLPINNMLIFYSYMSHYQRLYPMIFH